MGRIKTMLVKRTTHELMEKHKDKFAPEFEKNKEVLNTLISTPSKKLRNVIAGYVTRLVRKGKTAKKPSTADTTNELSE